MCIIMSSVNSITVCFRVDKYVLQSSSLTSQCCHVMPKLNWHAEFHMNISHTQNPTFLKCGASCQSPPARKKKVFLQEFKDYNKKAFKYRNNSVKRQGKKGKWNPVTRIIWWDDSSLVKGIGTAVLAGSPPNVIASASSQSSLFSVTLSKVIVKAEHLSAPAEKVAPPCQ